MIEAFDETHVQKFIYLIDKGVSMNRLIDYRIYTDLFETGFFDIPEIKNNSNIRSYLDAMDLGLL